MYLLQFSLYVFVATLDMDGRRMVVMVVSDFGLSLQEACESWRMSGADASKVELFKSLIFNNFPIDLFSGCQATVRLRRIFGEEGLDLKYRHGIGSCLLSVSNYAD